MTKYILALDQGTTGTRAFLFDSRSRVVASAYQEFKQYFPKPGWVEHDAEEIWQSCVTVIRKAIRTAGINPLDIQAIGITNQRETTVLWDRYTSRPVSRAIVWQCRRTADMCQSSRLKKYEGSIRARTGLVIDAYFSATKVRWLLDHVRGLDRRAMAGDICFGTIDSWLIWKLTGEARHVTDMTNASRTLLFNIERKSWDKELCQIFGVPAAVLPEVLPSGSIFGVTAPVAGLPFGIPIAGVMGDQQAALYGQGCTTAGTMKNTYGTGCFLVLNTGEKLIRSKTGLLTTIACDDQGRPMYALEGSVFMAGATLQWLRDQLKVIKTSAQSEVMVRDIDDTGGVYLVPAFTGLGAPYWDAQARGTLTGLTRGSDVRHIVRAALESIAYQTRDVTDLMQAALGKKILSLNVDGGACANNFLMQFQADMLNCRVVRPQMIDTTVQGVAHLAGVTVGMWKGAKDLERFRAVDRVFDPRMPQARRKALYDGWQKAVRQARTQ